MSDLLIGSPAAGSGSASRGSGSGGSGMHSPAVTAGSAIVTQRQRGGEWHRRGEEEGEAARGDGERQWEGVRVFEASKDGGGGGGGARGKKPASSLMDSVRMVRRR